MVILVLRVAFKALTYGESNVPLVVDMMKFIFLANFLGLPAISVPVGSIGGLPVGLQVVGNHWDEHTVLNLGRALESTQPAPAHPADYIDVLE